MFNADSMIVKLWVDQLLTGKRQPEEVPALGNLKDIVMQQYVAEKDATA